jgi:membrane-bound metal-dependent hydrolase YbcI (DUF457 family)
MYFFFHLVTGTILGLLIGDILHDRRWVLPSIFGSILPDLIDKPLGHILFEDSIGFGRIFTHTLVAALVLVMLGLVIGEFLKTPIVTGIAAGVISHQVLDLMWRQPKNWFYPHFGPFQGRLTADYFFVLWDGELNNPLELILASGVCAGLVVFVYRDRVRQTFSRYKTAWRGLLGAVALLLCGCAGFLIWEGLKKQKLLWTGWTLPEEYLIGGTVILLAGCMVWRWRRVVQESDPLFHR